MTGSLNSRRVFLGSAAFLAGGLPALVNAAEPAAEKKRFAIALHGGAGKSPTAEEAPAVEKSLEQEPRARMYVLTWEDLDEVLATQVRAPLWMSELRRYLYRKRLAMFSRLPRHDRKRERSRQAHDVQIRALAV